MGSLRVGQDWATSLSLFTFMHWRRKWQPAPVLLPGESQGQRSLMGCHLWGHTESDTTEATVGHLAPTAAAASICIECDIEPPPHTYRGRRNWHRNLLRIQIMIMRSECVVLNDEVIKSSFWGDVPSHHRSWCSDMNGLKRPLRRLKQQSRMNR